MSKEITSLAEMAEAVNNEMALVLFTAPAWCAPCQAFEPVYRALSIEGVNIFHVDVDKSWDLAVEYGVRGVPSLFLFVDGRYVKTIVSRSPSSILGEINV